MKTASRQCAQAPLFQAIAPSPQYPSFHFVKYMGSKREIIEWIGAEIEAVSPKGATILDLMSGSGAVSYAMAQHHRIVANDIQSYGTVLGRALLQTSCEVPRSDSVWPLLSPFFQQNQRTLAKFLGQHLKAENEFINTGSFSHEVVQRYEQFQSQYPHAGDYGHSEIFNGLGERFRKLVAIRRQNWTGVPYCLFTAYFANAYFGLKQSIDIDSLRYAIDSVFPEESELRSLALSCLMHSASYCTPGPGHFAQFRALNSVALCQDILRYRNRSVLDYFLNKWSEFREHYRQSTYKNVCDTLDYKEALRRYLSDADLVYVDPPYSFVHYSRFYHALETLVKYDYPESEFYGRYRTDRHQSPFCIRAQVSNAFESIIKPVAALRKKLVFSYANTGMIKLEKLKTLCRDNFECVQVKTNDYLHATMGRRGDKNREVKEALIICQP